MKLNNKYYILRHGEAESNVKDIVSCWPEKFRNHLTAQGNNSVRRAVQELKTLPAQAGKKINLIFSSDLMRAKETAEIAGDILEVAPIYDKRLREIDFGRFNSSPAAKFEEYFKNKTERVNKAVPEGENYQDVFKRVADFFGEINNKYKDKNILIIGHQLPLFFLEGFSKGFSLEETLKNIPEEKMLNKAELRELS
jgi:broad specificity phosphatase PhoE